MNCRYCGNPIKNGQPYCAYCGSPTQTNAPGQPPGQKRKTGTTVITMLMIFLSVAVVVGTAAFIITRIWSHSVNPVTAYEQYKQLIIKNKDSIDEYAEDNEAKAVSLYDYNNSGVEDLVYAVPDPDGPDGSAAVYYVSDEGKEVVEVEPHHLSRYIIFYCASDKSVYEYCRDGNTETYYLLGEGYTYKATYIRSYDEETDTYTFRYIEDGKEADSETAELRYKQLISKLYGTNKVVLLTDMTEDEINENIPGKSDYAATSADEVIDIIDDLLGPTEATEPASVIEDEDDATPDEVEESAEHEPEKINTADLPEQNALTSFLDRFTSSYWIVDNDNPVREYDSGSPDSVLIDRMIVDTSCVDFDLYPGEGNKRKAVSNSDPKRRFGNGYVLVEKDKALWVLQNIMNLSESQSKDLVSKAVSGSNVYETKRDNKTYLCGPISGKGGLVNHISFTAAKSDGEQYDIVFDAYSGDSKEKANDLKTYYAEMSLKTIDGKKYWTISRLSEKIPGWGSSSADKEEKENKKSDDTSKATEAQQTDVFGMFTGQYTFTSGAGAWGTTMTLNSDGTFSGVFSDTNMGTKGDGYDIELYYSEFSGSFSNPKKVNDYTYSFELESINYVYEPDTEEITDRFTEGTQALVKYWTAYGLDNGARTVYAYTADAPWDQLPEGFRSWVSIGRYGNTSNELGRKCLYAVEPEYGWMGSEE